MLAWRDLGRLHDPAAYVPWLRQITRNQALLYMRRRRRRRGDYADGDPEPALRHRPDGTPDHTHRLLDREARSIVGEVVDGLPSSSREVMVLFYREGLSIHDIAAQLGLREAAVKKRLSRARQRVRQEVLQHFGDALDERAPPRNLTALVVAACERAPAGDGARLGMSSLVLAKVLPGVLMGTAGVLFGFWLHWRRARDSEERSGLLRCTALNLGAAAVFPLALAQGTKLILLVALLGFMGLMAWNNLVRLPTVIARRQALERLEDPDAHRAQRRLRALGFAGLVVGLGAGLAAILVSTRPWW